MKVIMEFDLENEDDKYKYEVMKNGVDYQLFIEDFSQNVLRQFRKYGCEAQLNEYKENGCYEDTKDYQIVVDMIEGKFYNLMPESIKENL